MDADGNGDIQQTLSAKNPTNELTPQHSFPISLVVHKILQVPVNRNCRDGMNSSPVKGNLPAMRAPDRGPLQLPYDMP